MRLLERAETRADHVSKKQTLRGRVPRSVADVLGPGGGRHCPSAVGRWVDQQPCDRYERWYRFVASPLRLGPPPSVSSRSVPKRWTTGFSYFVIGPSHSVNTGCPSSDNVHRGRCRTSARQKCADDPARIVGASLRNRRAFCIRESRSRSVRRRVRHGNATSFDRTRWRRKSSACIY